MTNRYVPGDRVFAKLKGFPAWPGKVMERRQVKIETYKIYFYGTYQEANIKYDQLFDYNETNIAKFGKQKLKKLRFKEAMQEIADNLEIGVKPVEGAELAVSELGPETPNEQRDCDDDNEGELLIDEGPPPPPLRKESRPPTLTPAPPKMTPAPPRMTPAPNLRGIPGSGPTKVTPVPTLRVAPSTMGKLIEAPDLQFTPPKQGRRGTKGNTKKDLTPSGISTPPTPAQSVEAIPQPEIISRSGRKIKPKRFADEDLPISVAAALKSNDESKGSSDAPPSAKRSRRSGSTGLSGPALMALSIKATKRLATTMGEAAVHIPPVPTLKEKPKVSPAATVTNTRGRTRGDLESANVAIITPTPTPPAPALKAKPGIVAPPPLRRSRIGSTDHVDTPTPAIETSAPLLATKPTRSSSPTTKSIPKVEQEAVIIEFGGGDLSPMSEGEEVLGLPTPKEEDNDDKENNDTLSPGEEGQWLENGEEGELDSEEADGDEEEIEGDEEETSEVEDPLDTAPGERLAIMAKNGIDVELAYNEDLPEEFDTHSARVEWDLATARNVLKVRTELEKNEFAATDFLAQVARSVDTRDAKLRDAVSEKTREKIAKKINQLRMEGEMIEIIGEIVGCLAYNSADCDRALELLERMAGHNLNPLLLKKHPEVVQTVNKLRSYIGTPDQWEYDDAQKEEHRVKSGMIRDKASTIYISFKTLFCVESQNPFRETFEQHVQKFNEATSHIEENKVLSLVYDPTDPVGVIYKETKAKYDEELEKKRLTNTAGDLEMEGIRSEESYKTDKVLIKEEVENIKIPTPPIPPQEEPIIPQLEME